MGASLVGRTESLLSSLPAWAELALVVGAPALAGLLAQRVVWALLLRRRESPTKKLLRRSDRPARLLAGVTLGAIGLGLAGERGLIGAELLARAADIARLAGVLGATWLVIAAISGADDIILAKHRMDVRDNLRARRMHTQVRVLARVLMVLVAIVGVGVALMTFDAVERFGQTILASAGIAGLVVGFAAQPVLGNVIAGVQIALTQPIRLDDAVVIEGEWGWIEEITLTYVVVRIWDQRRLIVPFKRVIEQPFENWTRRTAEILGSVVLHVDYACPVDAVREELDRILDGHPKWDGRAKVLQTIDATDRTMVLRALVTAADSPTAWELRCDVRERLISFLQREHPYALPRERELQYEGDATHARMPRPHVTTMTHDIDDPTLREVAPPPPDAEPDPGPQAGQEPRPGSTDGSGLPAGADGEADDPGR